MADRDFILEILLRARDETSAAFASALAKMEAMNKLMDEQGKKSRELAKANEESQRRVANASRVGSEAQEQFNQALKGTGLNSKEATDAAVALQSAIERMVRIQAQGESRSEDSKKRTLEYAQSVGNVNNAYENLKKTLADDDATEAEKRRAATIAENIRQTTIQNARLEEQKRLEEQIRNLATRLPELELKANTQDIIKAREEIDQLRRGYLELFKDVDDKMAAPRAGKRITQIQNEAIEETRKRINEGLEERRSQSREILSRSLTEETRATIRQEGIPESPEIAKAITSAVRPSYMLARPSTDEQQRLQHEREIVAIRERLTRENLTQQQIERTLHAIRQQALRDYGFENQEALNLARTTRAQNRELKEAETRQNKIASILRGAGGIYGAANVIARPNASQTSLIQAQERLADIRNKLIQVTRNEGEAESLLQDEIDKALAARGKESIADVEAARAKEAVIRAIKEENRELESRARAANAPARVLANPRSTAREDEVAELELERVRQELVKVNNDVAGSERIIDEVRSQALRNRGFLTQAERDAARTALDTAKATKEQEDAERRLDNLRARAQRQTDILADPEVTIKKAYNAERELANIRRDLSRATGSDAEADRELDTVRKQSLRTFGFLSEAERAERVEKKAQIELLELVAKAEERVMRVRERRARGQSAHVDQRTQNLAGANLDLKNDVQDIDVPEGGNRLGGFVDDLQKKFSSLDTSTRGFDNALRSAIGFSVVALIQPVATAIVGLVGTFASLASAAVAAGTAMGVTFLSGMAQGIPVMGLFGAAMQRLTSIFGYVTTSAAQLQQKFIAQFETARMNALGVNQVAIAQHNYNNALYAGQLAVTNVGIAQHGYSNSLYSLRQAQRGVRVAELDLLQTRQQASRQLQDLVFQEQSARLAAEASTLAITDAQKALHYAIATGGDVAQAQMNLQQAQLSHQQNVVQAQRAIADARPGSIVRQGIQQQVEQSRIGVETARRAVVDAQYAVAQAERGIVEAQRAVVNSQFEMAQAKAAITLAQQAAVGYNVGVAAQLAWLRSRMTDTEKALAGNIERIYKMFQGPKSRFRPFTDAILSAFIPLTGQIIKLLNNQSLIGPHGALQGLANSMRDAIKSITDRLFSRGSIDNFLKIINAAAHNMKPLAATIGNIFSAMQSIIVTAIPYVHQFLIDVGKLTGQFDTWASSTRGQNWLKKFFDTAFNSLRAFINLGVAFARFFGAVITDGGGAKTGIGLIQSLTDHLNRATDSINHHGKVWHELQTLWSTVHPTLHALGEIFGALIRGFLQLAGSRQGQQALQNMAHFVAQIIIPALVKFAEEMGKITSSVFNFLRQHPALAAMLKDVLAFALVAGFLSKAIGLVFGPLASLIKMGRLLGGAFNILRDIPGRIGKIGDALKKLPDVASGIKDKLSSAAGALKDGAGKIRNMVVAAPGVIRSVPGRVAEGAARTQEAIAGGVTAAGAFGGRVLQRGNYLGRSAVSAVGRGLSRLPFVNLGADVGGAEAVGAAGGAEALTGGLSGIAAMAGPIGLVAAAIAAIAAATGNLGNLIKTVEAPFVAFWKEVKKPIEDAWGQFKYFIGGITDLISHIGGAFTSIVNHVLSPFGVQFKSFGDMAHRVVAAILGVIGSIAGFVGKIIGKVFGTIINVVGGIFHLLGDLLRGNWSKLGDDAKKIGEALLNGIVGILKTIGSTLWNLLKGAFEGLLALRKNLFNIGWTLIHNVLDGLWSIGKDVIGFGGKIVDWIVNGIKKAPHAILNAIKSLIPGHGIIRDAANFVKGLFGGLQEGGPVDRGGYGGGDRHPYLLESGEHVWTKEEVRNAGGHEAMYSMRRSYGGGGQSTGSGYAQGGAVGAADTVTIAELGGGPNRINIGRITDGVTGYLGQALDNIKRFISHFETDWTQMWKSVHDTTLKQTNSQENIFSDFRDSVMKTFKKLDQNLSDTWNNINQNAKTALTELYNNFKNSYTQIDTDTFNAFWYIGHTANQMLQGFQGQKIDFHLSGIPHMAEGGRVSGFIGKMGERGRDAVHTVLGKGEAVLNYAHQQFVDPALKKTYGWGLPQLFDKVRGTHAGTKGEAVGMAQGGVGGGDPAVNFYGASTNVQPVLIPLIRLMEQRWPGLIVTSTFRPGGTSYHARGEAVDLASGDANYMNRAASWVMQSGLYKSLVEGIHNPNLSVKNGQVVPATFWGASTWQEHLNHIHLAITGAIGQVANAAGGAIDATIQSIRAPHVHGLGAITNILNRAIRVVTDSANNFIAQQQPAVSANEAQYQQVPETGNYAQARKWTDQAMRIAHVSGDLWEKALLRQEYRESGYNPNAINRTDVNAQHGDPSRGILQVIGETFRRYALPGYDSNIYDPVSNIVAAIRYVISTYGGGDPDRGAQVLWSRGGGAYADGGEVGEKIKHAMGQAVPIIAHAGEWVLNKAQQHKIAKRMGTSVEHVKEYLGFTNTKPKTHYAAGGDVHPVSLAPTITSTGSVNDPASLEGVSSFAEALNSTAVYTRALTLITAMERHLNRSDKRLASDITTFLSNVRLMIGDNGVFALASQAIDNWVTQQGNVLSLAQAGFKLVGESIKTRVRGPESAVEAAQAALDNTVQTVKNYEALQAQEVSALHNVNAQLRRIGRPTRENLAIYQQLLGARQSLLANIRDADSKIAQGLNDQYTQASTLFQAQTDRALRGLTTLTGRQIGSVTLAALSGTGRINDTFNNLKSTLRKVGPAIGQGIASMTQSIAQTLGDPRNIAIADEGVLNVAQANLKTLQGRYAEAARRAQHDPRWRSIADDLLGQVESATEAVVSAQAQQFQDEVQRVETQAQRRTAFLDVLGRFLSVQAASGDNLGAAAGQVSLARGRADETRNQIADYQRLLGEAQQQGNVGQVMQLQEKIGDLVATLQENTLALQQAITAYREVSVDILNSRVQATAGLQGAAQTISQTLGAILPLTQNLPALIQQSQETGQALQGQRTSAVQNVQDTINDRTNPFGASQGQANYFLGTLVTAFQQGPQQYASALSSLSDALGQFESRLPQDQQTLFTNLVQALTDNTTATVTNTQQTQSLITQYRQLAISLISQQSQASSGFFQAAAGISQTLGQIMGNQNLTALISYARQTATELIREGRDAVTAVQGAMTDRSMGQYQDQSNTFLTQLLTAFQQGPQQYANTLAQLAPALSKFEITLPQEQQSLFSNLVQALTDNTTAVVNNNLQLQQLNASGNQQQFSTSAWQLFRQAIFTGMGTLIPQYAQTIPSMDVGGIITSNGVLYGHKDEVIVPAGVAKGYTSGDVSQENHFHITNPTEVADPVYLGNEIAFRLAHDPNSR